MVKEVSQRPSKAIVNEVVTREHTIVLSKRVHGSGRKNKAPKAIKAIKQFAERAMGTKDVRLDPILNKAVWEKGIRAVPTRVRVRLSRKRNEDENAKYKLYTYVTYVPVASFKTLNTEVIDE